MINFTRIHFRRAFAAVAATAALIGSTAAQAHCDTLDGPVVGQARKALDSGNVNRVLGWVQQQDEAEIRSAFQKAVVLRKGGGTARELADTWFFETLVRVHRAGEGAPYTGLKPAGEIEPAIAAADKSIETGKLEPVAKLVIDRTKDGLHRQFDSVAARKTYDPNDVAAGRAYVGAYVEYVHYVERLYNAAAGPQATHADEAPAAAKPAHSH